MVHCHHPPSCVSLDLPCHDGSICHGRIGHVCSLDDRSVLFWYGWHLQWLTWLLLIIIGCPCLVECDWRVDRGRVY